MAKSSSPPNAAQKRIAAERAAAARERIQAAQRRRRLTVIAASVGAVVLVVAAFVVVKVLTKDSVTSGKKTVAAQASVTQALAGVPASVFDKIGVGSDQGAPGTPKKPGGLGNGKPEVFYVGAEFCPFCAAERWPLTVALSRFGTFTHLGQTFSAPDDTNPNTPTLSYHGATYSSRYLTFLGKEIQSNQVNAARTAYTALDRLTAAQAAVYHANGKGYPFLDIAGKYTLNAAQYDGSILAGMNQKQVAAAISNPSTDISKAVVGSANVITARLCQVTGDKPGSVCSSNGVTAAARALASAS